jgi:hypothetical protein
MATEPIEELWGQWQREELSPERAIGQLLQHLLLIKWELEQLKQRPSKGSTEKKA